MEKCVIWGTGFVGQNLYEKLNVLGTYEVYAYCDTDVLKQGREINNYLVISPEHLKRLCDKKIIDYIIVGVRKKEYIEQIEDSIRKNISDTVKVLRGEDLENEYLIKVRENIVYSWEINFESQIDIWIHNFMGEVRFWVQEDANPNGEYHFEYNRRLDNIDFWGLDKTCESLADVIGNDSIVMDIGCGCVSQYGDNLPEGGKVQLLTIDPLAAFYNKINKKYSKGRSHNRQCRFGLFEFMANFYEENYCDAIIINNALDHCIDPYKSIVECLYILRKEGRMHLKHRRAEAEYEGYNGLHRWNIDYDKKDNLIIWNKQNAINVSDSLKSIAEIKVLHTDDYLSRKEQQVIVDIKKIETFALDQFFDMERERREMALFIENIMQWIANVDESYLDIYK